MGRVPVTGVDLEIFGLITLSNGSDIWPCRYINPPAAYDTLVRRWSTCRYFSSLRIKKNASSVIIFDVYHNIHITPAFINIFMNYSHSGGKRCMTLRSADTLILPMHMIRQYGSQPVSNSFPPSGRYHVVQVSQHQLSFLSLLSS